MGAELKWVGKADLERVAEARLLSYSPGWNHLADIRDSVKYDIRAVAGDYLLATKDGRDVGTATSLRLAMWLRGARLSCQGVAWVGTVKTARRQGFVAGESVANAVMKETLAEGRRRGHVVSALMPFRVSFYERFGYGVVERRAEWTMPLGIMPVDDVSGFAFVRKSAKDRGALVDLKQRVCEAGACDIERPGKFWWKAMYDEGDEGLWVAEFDADGSAKSWAFFTQEKNAAGLSVIRVRDWGAAGMRELKTLLAYFGSLRDQYWAVVMSAPADWPVNWLLKERQLPHRPVNHLHAECRWIARMQVRVLDHTGFFAGQSLAGNEISGVAGVRVEEPEGGESSFELAIDKERIAARPLGKATPVFACDAKTWAAVATGELRASDAVELGIASWDGDVLRVLGALKGRAPFCREQF